MTEKHYKYIVVMGDHTRVWHLPSCKIAARAKYKRGSNMEPAEYKAALEQKRGRTDYTRDRECRTCLDKSRKTSPTFTESQARRLFAQAHTAGMAAGNGHNPTPMVVYTPKQAFSANDISFTDDGAGGLVVEGKNINEKEPVYTVPGGVCGFAWITISPGNCSLARHAAKMLDARKGYYGGMEIWVRVFGQSLECKQAYAGAYAKVLCDAGVEAYSGSRLD